MDEAIDPVVDIESMCRGFLQNAAARQGAIAQVAPEAPTVEYLTGFGDGWEAGHVAALALVVSMISGESMTDLLDDAGSRAAVESAFPFDLVIVDAEPESAPVESAPPQAA
ncbi:MAG: hypothetical protein QOG82_38 [Actinomycetota bacterium]|jgi:hypothetical protein|nr:hypothetical protein [Actinomycetota bacterium]